MCNAAMAGASVFGGIGAFHEQNAKNRALDYNQRMAESNAKVEEIKAVQAEKAGEMDEKRHRAGLAQFKGSQRAAYGASGVVVDEGSSMDVLKDTAAQGELDALTIRRNAAMEAWGHRQQAKSYKQEKLLYKMQERNPWEAGAMGILSSGSAYGAQSYSSSGASKTSTRGRRG